MSQNQAARVALGPNGVGFLTTDGAGRLLTTNDAPVSATVNSFSADVANAAAVATLPAVADKTNRLAGILVSASGATAASVVLLTIAGLEGGTMTIPVAVPADVAAQVGPLVVNFTQPLAASAENIAIVVTLPALGAGNLHAAVSAWGDAA